MADEWICPVCEQEKRRPEPFYISYENAASLIGEPESQGTPVCLDCLFDARVQHFDGKRYPMLDDFHVKTLGIQYRISYIEVRETEKERRGLSVR